MLSVKEKENQRDAFIRSEKFGKPIYVSLMLFKQNVLGILNTIELFGIVVEKLDNKEVFDHTMTDEQIIRIKQYIVVEGISKIISIIEGLLVLIHSLSEGYSAVTRNMPHYKNKLVWDVRDKILSRSYSLQKVLAFLPTEELGLSREEESVLKKYYDETEKETYLALDLLVDFYEKYNIVYNKSKHGLTISAGGFKEGGEQDFKNSFLIAFHHQSNEEKMPRGYFKAKITEPSDQYWFNAEAHLNFNEKLFSGMGETIRLLRTLCEYIIDNHLNYANNCGVGYLPYKKMGNETYSILFHTRSDFRENVDIMERINKTILTNMVVSDYSLNMRHNYVRQDLLTSLQENSITNIFITNEENDV